MGGELFPDLKPYKSMKEAREDSLVYRTGPVVIFLGKDRKILNPDDQLSQFQRSDAVAYVSGIARCCPDSENIAIPVVFFYKSDSSATF